MPVRKSVKKKAAPRRGNRALFNEPTQFVAVRLPESVVTRIDEHLSKPGNLFRDRSDLIRQLVMRAAEIDFKFATDDRAEAHILALLEALKPSEAREPGSQLFFLARMIENQLRSQQLNPAETAGTHLVEDPAPKNK